MGLDMYLRAQKYVSGWRHNPDEETNEYERLVEMFGMGEFVTDDSPSAYVEFTVGYWRKANQVHSWFVRECQGGVDECQATDVAIEQLVDLREVCLRVLASTKLVPGQVIHSVLYSNEHPKGAVQMQPGQIMEDPTEAERWLAPEDGFFFGNQDFDEGYWQDLQRTVAIVDRCLLLNDTPGYWSFVYQSSW